MPYRAGSAFIAVSPSFRGFQTKAAIEAKKLRPIRIPVEYDHKKLIVGKPKPVKVGVDADTAAAEAKIRRVARPRRTTVGVDADTAAANLKLSAIEARLRKLTTGRFLINVGIVAAPMAAPLLGALAGGAAALGGIGAGLIGGIGAAGAVGLTALTGAVKAQKDLTAATEDRKAAVNGVRDAETALADASRGAAQTQLNGVRAIADAERALADARRAGAQAVADAERALAEARRQAARATEAAQQQLVDAQDAVRDSLEELHTARRQAVRDLEDLTAQVRANANAQKEADLSLLDARERLADVQANIFATDEDMRRARLDVAEAEDRVSDARRRSQQDAADLAKIEREGLDATDTVAAAQERLDDARVARARARVELQRARADAARAVADAERALGRARADAARSVADAERNLARARTDAAAANADAARQVAAAKVDLADAEADLAAKEAARTAALDKLTPAQRRMLRQLDSLKRAWHGFLLLVDRPLGGMMVSAMRGLEKALPGLARFLRPVFRALRDVFDLFGNTAASKGAKRFASDFGFFASGIIRDAGRGTRNLAIGLGELLRAFFPLSKDMSKGLVGLTRGFKRWAKSLSGSDGFRSFIDWVRTNGPKVLDVLKSVGGALISIGVALAPLGMALLTGLGAFADWLKKTADAHPLLIQVGAVVAIIVSGLSMLAGVLVPIIGLFTALTAPVVAVIAVLVAVGVGLVVLYKKSQTFRRGVDTVFQAVQRGATIMWNQVLKPIFTAWVWTLKHYLFPTIKFLWTYVVKPVFTFIGWIVKTQWKMVILPALKGLWSYLKNVLFPVLKFLWERVVKPVFTWVGDKISRTWRSVIKPVFEGLRDFITDTLVPAFRRGMDRIGQIWDGLKAAAAKPVVFLIDTVYNKGIVKVVNAIPGVDPLNEVHGTMAGLRFAGGGVMPGHTPGRDVHKFYSPTAGRLDLSGGEAIMRPEWTRMVGGKRAVDAMNRAARAGRRFFLGGVLPLTGAHWSQHTSGYDGMPWAGDLNVGSGYDDYGMPIRAWKSGIARPFDYGRDFSYGRGQVLEHPGGGSTLYAHMSRVLTGLAGTLVRAGQTIGYVGDYGNTGTPPTSHLHFEIRGGGADLSDVGGSVNAGAGGFNLPNPLRFLDLGAWKDKLAGMGPWGRMMGQAAGSIVGDFRDWASGKVKSLLGFGSTAATGAPWLDVAAGGGVKAIAAKMLSGYGWGQDQFHPLDLLWTRESGWRWNALNASSGAYGIPQALPASKMAAAGADWRTNPVTQMRWGLGYIKGRYGNPSGAWAHSQATGWYDRGGLALGRGYLAKQTLRPERVLSPRQTESFERLVDHIAYRGAAGTRGVVSAQQLRELAAAGSGAGATRFDLYDRDGKLWTSMTGIARGAVAGHRDFADTQAGAGMGGPR